MAEEIILRAEAIKQGLNYYFSGNPCPKGHVAKRTTRKGRCYVCRRESANERMKNNPDKRRKQKARYYLKYRDEHLARFKKYRLGHMVGERARVAKRKAIKKKDGAFGNYTALGC